MSVKTTSNDSHVPQGKPCSFIFSAVFKWSLLEILSKIASSLLACFSDWVFRNVETLIHRLTPPCIFVVVWVMYSFIIGGWNTSESMKCFFCLFSILLLCITPSVSNDPQMVCVGPCEISLFHCRAPLH